VLLLFPVDDVVLPLCKKFASANEIEDAIAIEDDSESSGVDVDKEYLCWGGGGVDTGELGIEQANVMGDEGREGEGDDGGEEQGECMKC